jgi:hypothetical protein
VRYQVFDAWHNGCCVERTQEWPLEWAKETLSTMTFAEVVEWALFRATETDTIEVVEWDEAGCEIQTATLEVVDMVEHE